jgi:hypothetical protein
MMKLTVSAFALIALTACATPSAGPTVGGERVTAVVSGDAFLFTDADANRDFVTTREEYTAAIAEAFQGADTDNNGSLGPLEWQSFSRTRLGGDLLGPFRLEMDQNVDNTITLAEFSSAFELRFARYDGNEDGRVTRPEMVRPIDQGAQQLRERPRTPPPQRPTE